MKNKKPEHEVHVKTIDFEKIVTLAGVLISKFDPKKKSEIAIEYDPELPSVKIKYFTA